jgi:hypothetical protein
MIAKNFLTKKINSLWNQVQLMQDEQSPYMFDLPPANQLEYGYMANKNWTSLDIVDNLWVRNLNHGGSKPGKQPKLNNSRESNNININNITTNMNKSYEEHTDVYSNLNNCPNHNHTCMNNNFYDCHNNHNNMNYQYDYQGNYAGIDYQNNNINNNSNNNIYQDYQDVYNHHHHHHHHFDNGSGNTLNANNNPPYGNFYYNYYHSGKPFNKSSFTEYVYYNQILEHFR